MVAVVSSVYLEVVGVVVDLTEDWPADVVYDTRGSPSQETLIRGFLAGYIEMQIGIERLPMLIQYIHLITL